MLHFWLEVLLRAIAGTFAAIGEDPAELRFSIFVFAFATILLLIRNRKKGLHAWLANVKLRFWRIVGEDVLIILGLGVLVLVYNALREPYRMWDEQRGNYSAAMNAEKETKAGSDVCAANLQTERVKSQLLGNQVTAQQTQLSGQQTLIYGQQSTTATQQSTFDLCVTTLAKANAPISQSTTMITLKDEPPNATTKHTVRMELLTNVSITPVKLLFACESGIKSAKVSSLAPSIFEGSIMPLKVGSSPFVTPKVWQIDVAEPAWSPERPLLLTLDYDVDDLGQCVVKR